MQGYRFASNEYRLFPIVFERNVCNVLKDDEFGLRNIYKCGSQAPTCPFKTVVCVSKIAYTLLSLTSTSFRDHTKFVTGILTNQSFHPLYRLEVIKWK